MRRGERWTIALAGALMMVPLAGCGGGDDAGGDGAARDAAAGPAEMPFDVATAGDVQGMVMFEGTPPQPEVIDMTSEPTCAEHWDEPPTRDGVDVTDGHLSNVFVYVREGLDDMEFPTSRDEAVIDQVGCRYTPHVSGAMTNQPVIFRNSDGILHNINGSPQANRPFNFTQPVEMDSERAFQQREVMIPVRCDVHGWMRAYIGVVAHPYHAVTGDGGSFDLSELPPGDYVVEAWHPVLGTQEQNVTVATGETAEVSFTFTEDMIQTASVPLGDPIDPHHHGAADLLQAYLGGAHGHADAHAHGATGAEPPAELR